MVRQARYQESAPLTISRSRYTPLDKVRVLVLGQDPYHGPNQAHGLSFSVRAPTPPPPSLKNIFKALVKDYPSFKPPPNNTGSLVPWAEQGVLMLNACLTVRRSEANSHQNRGWEQFTQKVVEIVCKGTGRGGKGVVILAWGTPAQKRVTGVDVGFTTLGILNVLTPYRKSRTVS